MKSLNQVVSRIGLKQLAIVGLLGYPFCGYSMEKVISWSASKSMTAALAHTINIARINPREELVGKGGPSPSNQALVIILTKQGEYVLMCKDYDLRKLPDGNFRPTHGALKASFGFGLPKDHSFQNSFEALLKGPANSSLYKLFDTINAAQVQTAPFVYSEGGQEWGPAVTIPLFLTDDKSQAMELAAAEKIVADLNQIASRAFAGKKADDIMTGRFRDFCLILLKTLLQTGSDQPAVLDASKLEIITVDGQPAKLWDESQMRKNLLPHVAAVTAEFYNR
jgi:hypothetical protein